ncbi:MAG TPA: alternative ribosome rescue aminoacyl-tRNA hydrolase ArfB [Polyangiaceae bacterium]|nr:alternative ribosome rescue aminoacyl-tRNA hydrolase ArfB [Polyangiaceae bacterium]
MPNLDVTDEWTIPAADLKFRYARSGGPGGQNVNKVATKAELRFDYRQSAALTAAQKLRLQRRYPGHVTLTGELVVASDSTRSRKQNEHDALARLAAMLRSIQHAPKARVATKVTRAQKRRRVEQKRQKGAQKRARGATKRLRSDHDLE